MKITTTQNIILIGGMGAGKTTIGRKLAERLGFTFYDSDKEIEERTGVSVAWIFELEGEAGFRQREHAIINDLTARKKIVLATGGGAILDPRNRELLAARGVVIYLQAELEEQLERVSKDKRRPLLQVGDRREVLDNIMKSREPLYLSIADFVIDTGHRQVNTVVSTILKKVLE